MPGGTGLELLRFTKEIAPDSFFLLMTALPDLDTAVDALNSGADRFVIKDHNYVEQLRRAVRRGIREPEVEEGGRVPVGGSCGV